MTVKILTAEAIAEEARWLRLMAYGQPGTGKTWMAASAGLDKVTTPCLFLEYRSQIASLRSDPRITAAIEKRDLVILRLGEYEDLNFIYTYLKTGKQKQLEELFGGAKPVSVVMDSTTELQRTEVMRRAGNTEDQFIRDVQAPKIADWGKLLNQFTLLARLFYDVKLEYHMAFFALEQTQYKKVKGELEPQVEGYCPAMQGQARDQFPAYALTLMRLVRAAPNSQHYCVGHTRASKTASKEQSGAFPTKIYGPTIPMLVKMLSGQIKVTAKARGAKEVKSQS